jgi:hypothetical protein
VTGAHAAEGPQPSSGLEPRPRPLADIAGEISRWTGFAATIVTAATGFGLLTAAQGDATVGLLGLLSGIPAGVFTVLAAFGVVRRGEPVVTPLSDPRDAKLRALVPLGPMGRIEQT